MNKRLFTPTDYKCGTALSLFSVLDNVSQESVSRSHNMEETTKA